MTKRDEERAIERLIRQINDVDKMRSAVPRRIFALFAIVIVFGAFLMVFALKFGRRDRPIRPTRPATDF